MLNQRGSKNLITFIQKINWDKNLHDWEKVVDGGVDRALVIHD